MVGNIFVRLPSIETQEVESIETQEVERKG